MQGITFKKGDHHGKPAFQKQEQIDGNDFYLYYWDERDGNEMHGWWFGPSMKSCSLASAFAKCPYTSAELPPPIGWHLLKNNWRIDLSFQIGLQQCGTEAQASGKKRANQSSLGSRANRRVWRAPKSVKYHEQKLAEMESTHQQRLAEMDEEFEQQMKELDEQPN